MDQKPRFSPDYLHGNVVFMTNESGEVQESADFENRSSPISHAELTQELPVPDQQLRLMIDCIEPAERPSTSEVHVDIRSHFSESSRVYPSSLEYVSDVQAADTPWPIMEPQLEMASRSNNNEFAIREDDENSNRWHPSRCCCWFRSERSFGVEHHAPPSLFPASCICQGCEIEDENLETHLHCVRGCYIFAEIMRNIEPCVKVRTSRFV
jgi:hypothetical protein